MPPATLTPRELADALASQPENKEVLDALASLVEGIRVRAGKNLEYGFDDDYGLFIRKMFLLSAQSYGGRVQNYYGRRFKMEKVPASAGRGDLVDAEGNYFEFKFSFASRAKRNLDVVQIRLHQPIEGYVIMGSDAANNFEPSVFVLSKAQMIEECTTLGANSAHGTKSAVSENKTRELRFSISMDGEHMKRWRERYLNQRQTAIFKAER